METLYRKVMINGVEDLPKEDGEYFVCNNKFGLGTTHYWKVNKSRENTWLTQINWYLIEDSEQSSSKELRALRFAEWFKSTQNYLPVNIDGNDGYIDLARSNVNTNEIPMLMDIKDIFNEYLQSLNKEQK